MWAIRVLNGNQAGQIFPLKKGANQIGRSSKCDIRLLSPSVSKTHFSIEIRPESTILRDLESRNGVFKNGVQVQKAKIRVGDRLSINELVFDIVSVPKIQALPNSDESSAEDFQVEGNLARSYPDESEVKDDEFDDEDSDEQGQPIELKDRVNKYLDEVLLPGIYKLPQIWEFRWVTGLLIACFVFLVTSLSTIPLVQILKESVEQESQQHALTLAAGLARANRGAMAQGISSALNVDSVLGRSGVKKALIISKADGSILAPASQAGSHIDIPFVHSARFDGREAVRQINSDTVVALSPIVTYLASKGENAVSAFAVIVYDMDASAIGGEKTFSLFMQTLLIASFLGLIVFFFLSNLFEQPLKALNKDLDQALTEPQGNLETPFRLEILQKLTANINAALNRSSSIENSSMPALTRDRSTEMSHLVDLIGHGALAIEASSGTIKAANAAFEYQTGLAPLQLIDTNVEQLGDQSLRGSIEDLIARSQFEGEQIITNELEFSGTNCQIALKTFFGPEAPDYYVVVILPLEDES